MSARKLQQEFDKTNKKISEGLTAFEEIYDKLMGSEISSQKEKLESDLKKEIKKLQRLRDQLKTWLSDSSIKLDKNLLLINRTKIEKAMDDFKDLEKSSKIKQFSNEGLELQSQNKSRYNRPEDAKKEESFNYITDVIEQLNQQNESLDIEIHQLSSLLKKAKSSNSSSIQSKIDDKRYIVERNIKHLTMLERILRNLENENLDAEKIDDIKEDLAYYIENNQDEDYVEYDDFYDVLEMDDDIVDDVQGSLSVSHIDEEDDILPTAAETEPAAAKESHQKPAAASIAPAVAAAASAVSTPKSKTVSLVSTPTAASASLAAAAAAAAAAPPPLASYTNIIKSVTNSKAPPPGFKAAVLGPSATGSGSGSATIAGSAGEAQDSPAKAINNTNILGSVPSKTSTPAPSTAASSSASNAVATPQTPIKPTHEEEEAFVVGEKSFFDTIPRLSTIPQSRLSNPLPFQSINQLLESSLLNCPDSFDAEKPRQYSPINTHPSSVDFPQEPMYELNSSNMMKKFDNDTLFFCFYYGKDAEISKWNAARELSARGWVFNSESKQWFLKDKSRQQSVAEGSNVKEDSSTENFKYFDYEKTWLTRRRENFQFLPEFRESFV